MCSTHRRTPLARTVLAGGRTGPLERKVHCEIDSEEVRVIDRIAPGKRSNRSSQAAALHSAKKSLLRVLEELMNQKRKGDHNGGGNSENDVQCKTHGMPQS